MGTIGPIFSAAKSKPEHLLFGTLRLERFQCGGFCMHNGAFCMSKFRFEDSNSHMQKTKAYAAASATSALARTTISRRDPTDQDVQIEILFCGVCHSDLHQVRNEWVDAMPTVYPCVPGHEILGRVTKAGSAVLKFKPGDLVAVGCMVDSDGT